MINNSIVNMSDKNSELLDESLWGKLKSIMKGKGSEEIKTAHIDSMLKIRSNHFKNRFGGILYNMKQLDPNLKIGDKFGGIDVKPYQSDVQQAVNLTQDEPEAIVIKESLYKKIISEIYNLV